MKLLLIADGRSDFADVLDHLPIEVTRVSFDESVTADLTSYDAYCVLASGKQLDARIRERLEAEADAGKRIFTAALSSFRYVYSASPIRTVRKRLIYAAPEKDAVPGLATGDLLDDMNNLYCYPHVLMPEMTPLLYYHDYVIAHDHTDMPVEDIRKSRNIALWTYGDNVMMAAFSLQNFNKARFGPRAHWQALITYIAEWLTGCKPEWMPEPFIAHEAYPNLDSDEEFERARKASIDLGIKWLEQFLIDEGKGGIYDGYSHEIDPDGTQARTYTVRADCIGECAGTFEMYAQLTGKSLFRERSSAMYDFNYGPMLIKGGAYDGLLRWTSDAWGACYQDDVARATLYDLLECALGGDRAHVTPLEHILDFLAKSTPKDGLRPWRTDAWAYDAAGLAALAEAEHGTPSAHYNAYYDAILLLGYRVFGKPLYLEKGRAGLETLMELYPETRREQSETQEMCRLVLPLALLYEITGEEKHREMLYRVTADLQKLRHPFGGYMEWDTGYKAACSRDSRGECSLLTENGDPVADQLYSSNWLPMGFGYAYHVTGDPMFKALWRDIVIYFLRTQLHCTDARYDGAWSRAFDMNRREIYACPHDAGWAAACLYAGWSAANILAGMMLPDYLALKADKEV